MTHLYSSKDYHWALFMGHLVIEKLLKASIVKVTQQHAPLSHDLRRLAKLSGITFSTDHTKWLDAITSFNINARYDSYKQEFYKKCTPEYTDLWISHIKTLRQWIKMKL
ncbi:HEPN domain-containing protein [Catalinimonas niigatensis]|uniref:HEPN domain-containing protein n=1 Tax=Catalinimonas niigatensis TaxID=1397264 RepID=UPI002666EBEC|nr:HEPN domain-containing protein [Catalinimonas niigatensis]WPP49689.1 HEPN domain-containing protein [Catalinimonas niigatensis]